MDDPIWISKNVSLSPEVLEMGAALAREDLRTFSAEMRWLIMREFAARRRCADPSPEEPEPVLSNGGAA